MSAGNIPRLLISTLYIKVNKTVELYKFKLGVGIHLRKRIKSILTI